MPRTTKEATYKKDKRLDSTSTSTKKRTSKTVARKTNTKSQATSKSKSKVTSSLDKKSTLSNTPKKVNSGKKSPSKTRLEVSTKSNKKISNSIDLLEYYDLPYRYNETVVKILAQTPKTLFVYWDISDNDKEKYIKQYGESFFENTKPVLIVHNNTMNYTFEIEINDFANCWYFNINDEKCDYTIELGRKKKENINTNIQLPNNYLYITSSNTIESPNGHILFEKKQENILFRDVKTNNTFFKSITDFNFVKYLRKSHDFYNIYKKIYKKDEFIDGYNNPTSKFF